MKVPYNFFMNAGELCGPGGHWSSAGCVRGQEGHGNFGQLTQSTPCCRWDGGVLPHGVRRELLYCRGEGFYVSPLFSSCSLYSSPSRQEIFKISPLGFRYSLGHKTVPVAFLGASWGRQSISRQAPRVQGEEDWGGFHLNKQVWKPTKRIIFNRCGNQWDINEVNLIIPISDGSIEGADVYPPLHGLPQARELGLLASATPAPCYSLLMFQNSPFKPVFKPS